MASPAAIAALTAILLPVGLLSTVVVWSTSVSTVKLRLAGLASVVPASSVARTWSVWAPSARPE